MPVRRFLPIARRAPVAILVTLAVAATWASPSVVAAEFSYTSSPYQTSKVSGPNQLPIDQNWGENNSGSGVCSRIWEFLGGENYVEIASTCVASPWYGTLASGGCYTSAHGTVARYYQKYEYVLSGHQYWDGCT